MDRRTLKMISGNSIVKKMEAGQTPNCSKLGRKDTYTWTDRAPLRTLSALPALFCMILLVWNITLHVQQSRQSQTNGQVQPEASGLNHRSLGQTRASSVIQRLKRSPALNKEGVVGDIWNTVGGVIGGEDLVPQGLNIVHRKDNLISSLMKRRKRNTDQNRSDARAKNRNGKKSKKRKSGQAAHFVVHVDEEITPSIGTRNVDGSFIPNDLIYRFWEPTKWSSSRSFALNRTTGKVAITRDGYYLLYSQVVYTGSDLRRSYGIYINDEPLPFAAAYVFNHIHKPEPSTKSTNTDKQSNMYTDQCNIVAARYLKAADEVFIKALESNRAIVTQPHLTYWGIAKL